MLPRFVNFFEKLLILTVILLILILFDVFDPFTGVISYLIWIVICLNVEYIDIKLHCLIKSNYIN